jgi:hypothetical protein
MHDLENVLHFNQLVVLSDADLLSWSLEVVLRAYTGCHVGGKKRCIPLYPLVEMKDVV